MKALGSRRSWILLTLAAASLITSSAGAGTVTYTPPPPDPNVPCYYGYSSVVFTGGDGANELTIGGAAGGVDVSLPADGPCTHARFDYGLLSISDPAHKMRPSGCTPVNGKRVVCPMPDVLTIYLQGGDDTLSLDFAISPGSRTEFASPRTSIFAGGGNDSLRTWNGARDQVSCGTGIDSVLADSIDTISSDCENVTRI